MAKSPKSQRPGPWSLRDISDDAKETAKRRAKTAGMTVGTWVNTAIIAQGKAEEDRQLPSLIIQPEGEITPFWRWMRRKMGIGDQENNKGIANDDALE